MDLEFLQKNIWLVLIAVGSGAMLIWPLISRLISGAREVNVTQAVQLLNRRDALMLDVRDAGEFAEGHVPNSKHIPLNQLEGRLRELEKYKSRPIIVNGDSRIGQACSVLRKNGFAEVLSLRGGIAAWRQDNLPVEKK
jgi:rhodanese-related sulfurtransferase